MPDITLTLSSLLVSKLQAKGFTVAQVKRRLRLFLEDLAIMSELQDFHRTRNQAIEDAARQQIEDESAVEEQRLRDELA